jgi:hypothetical protein
MKREPKVGDRVYVLGFDSNGNFRDDKGVIDNIPNEKVLWVLLDTGGPSHLVCIRSIKLLKKKDKPVEARRIWVNPSWLMPGADNNQQSPFSRAYTFGWTKFREVLPGEIIITREGLEAAYDREVVPNFQSGLELNGVFEAFCKRLRFKP